MVFAFMVAFSCFGALNGMIPRVIFISLRDQTTGSVFTSSRLIYEAGRERFLPEIFGRLHRTRKTPLNATLLQAGITIAFILIGGGFRSLINFSVVASWAFYFLTVSFKNISIIPHGSNTIRLGPWTSNFTDKGANVRAVCLFQHIEVSIDYLNCFRPYKTWIITPLIFCGVCTQLHFCCII